MINGLWNVGDKLSENFKTTEQSRVKAAPSARILGPEGAASHHPTAGLGQPKAQAAPEATVPG